MPANLFLSLSHSVYVCVSLSLSLSRSWCIGGDVEDGSSGCSAEENGKKGRWMEWRPGMIRRRSGLGCGVCPVVVVVVVVVVVDL